MTGIPLFIAEPTGTCRLSLRRFCYGEDASGHYHDACAAIDENAPVGERKPDGTRQQWTTDERISHGDPRWPVSCGCGYQFTDDDQRQVNEVDWYEGGGQRFAWGPGSWEGPPGAMIRAAWQDIEGRPPAWTVFLPNGTSWNTNDPSASGGPGNKLGPCWEVTGEAPLITVSPSIDDQSPERPWHGWIRDGKLVPA